MTNGQRAVALHGRADRIMPKVPGANANNLATNPQMGTDHHRLSNRAKLVRNAQIRKPASYTGRASLDLVTMAQRYKPVTMPSEAEIRAMWAPEKPQPRANVAKLRSRKAAR